MQECVTVIAVSDRFYCVQYATVMRSIDQNFSVTRNCDTVLKKRQHGLPRKHVLNLTVDIFIMTISIRIKI